MEASSTSRHILKRIVDNPYINLMVGAVLLISGITETIDQLDELKHFRLASHHGLILFSLLHMLKSLSELFESAEYLDKGRKLD